MRPRTRIVVKNIRADWTHPTEIRFGVGRIRELPEVCMKCGVHRPLLVTDQGLARLGIIKDLFDDKRSHGIETGIFSEISGEPGSACVKRGARAFKEGRFDGVIAIGGGSPLDGGKAIALAATVGMKNLWDFVFGAEQLPHKRKVPPVVAVPTTAGTGSEVDASAVIIDEAQHVKRSLYHPGTLPRVVIADPALTRRLPPFLTAATGMDALSHHLEALCSPLFHPILDAVSYQGIRYIKDWLPAAFHEGRYLLARVYTMAASIMGAIAFEKGLGAMHALAHAVGAVTKTPHGRTVGVILPYVLKFNRRPIREKMVRLAHFLELPRHDFEAILDWTLSLRWELGIPHSLREIGVGRQDVPAMVEKALVDGNALTNPVPLSPENTTRLLYRMIQGKL